MPMYKKIRLTPDKVQHFVYVAGKCDFDIDIFYNRYVVDAKSIMGIFSLDLSKPIKVEVHSEDADKFISEISKFIVD